MRFAAYALFAAALLALGSIAWCGIEAARTMRALYRAIPQMTGDVDATRTDVHALMLPTQKAEADIAALALSGAQVAAKERNAFDAQQRYYADLATRTDALLDSANKTLNEVHDGIIPAARDNLDAIHSAVVRGDDGISALGKRSEATLDSLNADATALRPAIDSFAQITANGARTSANLDATSADVRAFIHRETTPVRGTWNVIKSFLRDFAGPAAQVGTAVK